MNVNIYKELHEIDRPKLLSGRNYQILENIIDFKTCIFYNSKHVVTQIWFLREIRRKASE